MNENMSTAERVLRITSSIISVITIPLLIPVIAFTILFLFTVLQVMPIEYKLLVVGIVACFTLFLPVLLLFLYLRITSPPTNESIIKFRKHAPYPLTVLSLLFCVLMMYRLNTPWYMTGIILTSILAAVVFFILNLKWNFSSNVGGIGAITGGVISFADVFGYNPVLPLCIFIVVAGVVGTARMILGKNTLNQVIGGFTIGLLCAVLVLHPAVNTLLIPLF